MPLGSRIQKVFGAACIKPALSADEAGREHATAMGALVGQALLRLELNQSMQAAQAEAQRQQLQNTFLASISHDLRTPLSAIVGGTSVLLMQGEKLTNEEGQALLRSIARESEYLSTVTENTLQLVRLGTANQGLRTDWESIEEVIGAALARLGSEDAARVKLRLPQGLPLIKADPVLLTQLLVNLLENALKYSNASVQVQARLHRHEIELFVWTCPVSTDSLSLFIEAHGLSGFRCWLCFSDGSFQSYWVTDNSIPNACVVGCTNSQSR